MPRKKKVADMSKAVPSGPVPHNTVMYQLLVLAAQRVAARLRESKSSDNLTTSGLPGRKK